MKMRPLLKLFHLFSYKEMCAGGKSHAAFTGNAKLKPHSINYREEKAESDSASLQPCEACNENEITVTPGKARSNEAGFEL